jgi:DedD protein
MAKQITDDEDRLKRQARRRLIGAVALTTAIVVVLPMVLDSEPKPIGQDIELRIPDKEKAGAYLPRLEAPQIISPVVSTPASALGAAVIPPTSSPVSQGSAPVVTIVKPPIASLTDIKSAAVPAKSAETVPEKKTAANIPLPKAEHTPKPKSEPKAEHARTSSAVHTEQGQPVPQNGFVVQIGAFGNADTAHSWQKNLIQQGFKAYTEKVGTKTRVRAGPYATREAANKARHKLEAKGLKSNIVELE